MRRLMVLPLLICSLFMAPVASAMEVGMFNLDGHGIVGSNVSQGTYFGFGVDFYAYVEDQLAVGLGAYYTAGSYPSLDREIGYGPFVSYGYPILRWLIASAREDIDYLDERSPFYNSATMVNDYNSYYGIASITTVALSLMLTNHFGVSAGYRMSLALNNSDLAKDHSGFVFGVAFSF